MAQTYKRVNGLDWPKSTHDTFIELLCWKKWREEPYCQVGVKDPWDCFFRAMRGLLRPDDFIICRWTEEHVRDWTMEDFIITWGAAASSKSNDYGLMAVVDWIIDPMDTYTVMASTTKEALKLRCFESVLRYFKILKHTSPFLIPGKLSKTMTAIINDDEADELSTSKASIRGVAVDEGSQEEAVGKLRGGHAKYTRLILDELSQMKPAALAVRTNMAIGARNSKVAGLTNIDSLYDLAGQFSVPLDGWSSVNPDIEFWRTQWGAVRRHDGIRSPAIVEPNGAKKYPHILNQETLDMILKQEGGNEDAPQIWTMVRAWPSPQGKTLTVMTEAEVAEWKMQEDVEWAGDPLINGAGLDPAFVAGGNKCMFQPFQMGYNTDDKLIIKFGTPHQLIIQASSDTPAMFQVTEQTIELCKKYNIQPQNLGVDDSATQSVADVLDRTWGVGCLRIPFGGRPTELPVSEMNPQPESKRYKDQATALWYAMREFGNAGQIRGLDPEAAKQFTRRRVKKPTLPLQLVSKEEFEKTVKHSPDEADACALALAVVKQRLGIFPGASRMQPKGLMSRGFTKQTARRFDIDSRSTYSSET